MKALTERQQLVLKRLAAGLQMKQIAAELGVTTQAVHKHAVAARRKLGQPSRIALVAFAIRQECAGR